MSTVITTDQRYMPLMCRLLDYTPTPHAVTIVCADAENGQPVAGVVYDGYNGSIIHAHIWADPERMASREWWAAIFDYPFNRCNVKKIVGQVKSSNTDAIKLDEKLGFVKEAEVTDYYPDGDSLLAYTMTREQCRVLNSKAWAEVVQRVKGV